MRGAEAFPDPSKLSCLGCSNPLYERPCSHYITTIHDSLSEAFGLCPDHVLLGMAAHQRPVKIPAEAWPPSPDEIEALGALDPEPSR